MNWLRWLFVEGRRFEKVAWVMARLDETLGRVERLAERRAYQPAMELPYTGNPGKL